MAASTDSIEKTYYLQVWYDLILTQIPKQLRIYFKSEWRRIRGSDWQEGISGPFLFSREPKFKQDKWELKKIRTQKVDSWDVSVLTYALGSTSYIGAHLSPDQKNNIKLLRENRNFVAHDDGFLSKDEKDKACNELVNVFTAIGLDTTEVLQVQASDTFNTPDLMERDEYIRKLEEEISNYKKGKRHFVMLPPPAGNEAIPRDDVVGPATQKLSDLKTKYPKGVTELHLTGNPGCGKSQAARQIGELLAERNEHDVIMTLNYRNDACADRSMIELAQRLGVSETYLQQVSQQKSVYERLKIVNSVISAKLRDLYDYWLLIVDNVESNEFRSYWPQSTSTDWGSGQVIVASQIEDFVNEADDAVRWMSLKEGLPFEAAKLLMQSVAKKQGDDDDLRTIWQLLDKQPLSITHAALEVLYAGPRGSWNAYRKTCEKRLSGDGIKKPAAKIISSTSYPYSMVEATIGCVKRMCAVDAVWKYTFHFLSWCTADNVPYDMLQWYLLNVPELQEEDEDVDEFTIPGRLNSCSLLFVDSFTAPGVQGNNCDDEYLTVHTHQVTNKVLTTVLREICVQCQTGELPCADSILKNVQGYVTTDLSATHINYWRIAPLRNMLQPHLLKMFRRLSPHMENCSLEWKELFFDSFICFADLCYSCGHVVSAETFIRKCLTIESLSARESKKAEACMQLAKCLVQQQRPKEAKSPAFEALRVFSDLQKEDPTFTCRLLESKLWVSSALLDLGEMTESLRILNEVISEAETARPDRWENLWYGAHSFRGTTYHRLGLLKKSEESYILVRDLTETTNVIQYTQSLNNLGWLYCCTRELTQALVALNKAEKLFLNLFPVQNYRQAYPAINLGIAYRLKGDLELAEKYSRAAVCLFENDFGTENVESAEANDYLGMVLYEKGLFEQARKLHNNSIRLWRLQNGSKHSKFARFLENAGHVARAQKRFDDAEKLYDEAVENMDFTAGEENPETRLVRCSRALLWLEKGQNTGVAKEEMLKSLQILEVTYSKESPLVADCCQWLGYGCLQADKAEEAKMHLQHAMNIFSASDSYGSENVKVADVLMLLGECDLKLGESHSAAVNFGKAADIFAASVGSDHYKCQSAVEKKLSITAIE